MRLLVQYLCEDHWYDDLIGWFPDLKQAITYANAKWDYKEWRIVTREIICEADAEEDWPEFRNLRCQRIGGAFGLRCTKKATVPLVDGYRLCFKHFRLLEDLPFSVLDGGDSLERWEALYPNVVGVTVEVSS